MTRGRSLVRIQYRSLLYFFAKASKHKTLTALLTSFIMKILAIETSADETSIAIVDFDGDQVQVLSHLVNSQIEMHREYGGIYPSVAKREHARNITPMLAQALEEAGLVSEQKTSSIRLAQDKKLKTLLEREPETFKALVALLESTKKPNIDMIAVTQGPGLEPTLWVGVNVAKALGMVWDIPVVPTNHMEGHIVSALLSCPVRGGAPRAEGHHDDNTPQSPASTAPLQEEHRLVNLEFPALALLISGGHTELILVKAIGDYEKIGRTRDDAVGEAFDKVARLLGLPYPGGPEISKLANSCPVRGGARGAEGYDDDKTPQSHQEGSTAPLRGQQDITLPRPMLHSDDYDFSFSGLKTAVRYLVQELEKENKLDEQTKADIAREFQNAVTEVLLTKTRKAVENYDIKTLIIGGGVSANKQIREAFKEMVDQNFPQTKLLLPGREVTGDNALMIAVAAYLKRKNSDQINSVAADFSADGNLSL